MKPLQDILNQLRQEHAYLAKTYHVASLGVFGSLARGEATEHSDVDIVVSFSEPIGLDFVDLADYLETLLQTKVDLVPRQAIQPHYWAVIEPEVHYA